MTRGAYSDVRDELVYTQARRWQQRARTRGELTSRWNCDVSREFGRAPLVTRDDWSTSLLCLLLPLGILRIITVLTNNPRLSTDSSSPVE